jgi:hypothetical protein
MEVNWSPKKKKKEGNGLKIGVQDQILWGWQYYKAYG